MKKLLTILTGFILLMGSTAYAGPFGLHMGMQLSDFEKGQLLKISNCVYKIEEAPKKHPTFEYYLLVITPKEGLCKIKAIGEMPTNIYGDSLKSGFNGLEKALKNIYGENKRFDFLHSGSIWNNPWEWTMSLLQKERTLMSFWNTGKTGLLKDDICSICLQIEALDISTGTIRLDYEFDNFEKGRVEIEISQNSAL